jgi:DNA-binding transcriptional regulator PaaX
VKRSHVQKDVLDYLDIYHGWRTSHGIALDINAKEDSVGTALTRLRRQGLVKSRPRLDSKDGAYRLTLEWRACG